VGIVFAATNTEVDTRVAIKCLRPEFLVDPGVVSRFSREAKAAAAIKSEYAAKVYDVGTSSDGVPYMVMEYLDGKDLSTVLAEKGMLDVRTAVECGLQVCEALAIAHSKGIVHRDIKPENLFLTEQAAGLRVVKVVDFGISKAALSGSSDQDGPASSADMGSPLYMSPEQIRSAKTVDVRSDIWSLGMVLYEALAGVPAFQSTSIPELCVSILQSTPARIDSIRQDVPPGLAAVIHRCLQKSAAQRYQDVAELAIALMQFGPGRARRNAERALSVLQESGHVDASITVPSTFPTGAYTAMPVIPRPPSVPAFQPVSPEPAPEGDVRSVQRPRGKIPLGVVIGAVVALLLACVAVAVTARRSAPQVTPNASSTAKP
jgi:serine/threonine-protein kinase